MISNLRDFEVMRVYEIYTKNTVRVTFVMISQFINAKKKKTKKNIP